MQRDGRWWICIPANQTKGRRAIEVPFPHPLIEPLELYLAVARPMLLARCRTATAPKTGPVLWINTHGGPLTDRCAYGVIIRQTRIGIGTPVNPHAFRHAAATSLSLESPADAQMAAPLLGHSRFATTEKSYRMALQIETSRAYGRLLQRLRGS